MAEVERNLRNLDEVTRWLSVKVADDIDPETRPVQEDVKLAGDMDETRGAVPGACWTGERGPRRHRAAGRGGAGGGLKPTLGDEHDMTGQFNGNGSRGAHPAADAPVAVAAAAAAAVVVATAVAAAVATAAVVTVAASAAVIAAASAAAVTTRSAADAAAASAARRSAASAPRRAASPTSRTRRC